MEGTTDPGPVQRGFIAIEFGEELLDIGCLEVGVEEGWVGGLGEEESTD